MKTCKLILIAVSALLCSCATTDGDRLTVGNVKNSECNNTRAVGVKRHPKLKLTREGSAISGVIDQLSVSCGCTDVTVNCLQEGKRLEINAQEKEQAGSGEGAQATNCRCNVNVYFTVYDTDGDEFYVVLNGQELGRVSFSDHSVVEIDCLTKEQAFEAGFEYPEMLSDFYFQLTEYHSGYDYPRVYASISNGMLDVGADALRLPAGCTEAKGRMEKSEDGVLNFTLDTDTKNTEGSDNYAHVNFRVENAEAGTYRIKAFGQELTVTGETQQVQNLYPLLDWQCPVEKATLETTPYWLVEKLDSGLYYNMRVYRGQWNGRTIYFLYGIGDPIIYRNLYYEDGSQVVWSQDDKDFTTFLSSNENWTEIRN